MLVDEVPERARRRTRENRQLLLTLERFVCRLILYAAAVAVLILTAIRQRVDRETNHTLFILATPHVFFIAILSLFL